MIYSRFDSALAVRVYLGEPLTLELQLATESGSVEQLAGRVFDLVLTDIDGTTIAGASAPAAITADESGPYATATLDGGQTALLAGVTEPSYFFREILANGSDPVIRGKVEVYPAPSPGAGATPPALGTSGRFVKTVASRATRTVAIQRGARGFTPEERLAFTRDPDTGEAYIAEPSVPAMADWLTGIANAGSEGAIEASTQALAAAQAATAAAQQANSASVRGIDLPWNGADQTADLRALVSAGYNAVRLQPKKTYRFSNLGGLPVVSQVDRDSFALIGNDTLVQHVWDPANPATLLNFYDARGGRDHAISGITYEPSPRVDTQGSVRQVVTGVNTADVIFAVPPAFEPAFTSGDNLLRIETYPDGSWGCSAGKYKTAGKSRPFPLMPHLVNGSQAYDAPTGWKLYKASPTDVGVKPSGVVSYTPQLIFSMVAGELSGNEEITGSLYPGALGVLLNGKTFATELLEDSDPDAATAFTIRDAATGAYIDAASAVDVAIGAGVFTIPAAPSWLVSGIELIVHCRKRGSNPVYMRGVQGTTSIQMRFKGSVGVPLFLWDLDTLYLDVLGRGDGYSATNAGPVNVFNVKAIFGRVTWFGSGDDVFNARTRSYQSRVRAWDQPGLLWCDIEFNPGNAYGNNPTKPKSGDKLEFALNLDVRQEATVTVATVAVSPLNSFWTRITFVEGAMPADFNPATCRILNRSTVPVIDLDKLSSMASWGRTLVCQSHDCRIRELTSIGTRLPPVLALSSNGRRSGSLGDGGFKGGLRIDKFVARHSAIDVSVSDTSDLRALIRIEAKTLDQKPLGGPTGWRRCVIGTFDAEDYPYTNAYVEGVDLDIIGRSVRQGGRMRPSTLFGGYGNSDYVARYGTIALGGRNAPGYDESFLELDQGFVTFIGGSGLRSAGTLDPNAVAVTAAKNVSNPGDVEIRIGGGPSLQPTSYTANGSRTLTLVAPAITSGSAIAYAVTHTRN